MRLAQSELIGRVCLRIPVAIELIPVLGMLADARAELIGELLRRRVDGFVARTIAATTIGSPGRI